MLRRRRTVRPPPGREPSRKAGACEKSNGWTGSGIVRSWSGFRSANNSSIMRRAAADHQLSCEVRLSLQDRRTIRGKAPVDLHRNGNSSMTARRRSTAARGRAAGGRRRCPAGRAEPQLGLHLVREVPELIGSVRLSATKMSALLPWARPGRAGLPCPPAAVQRHRAALVGSSHQRSSCSRSASRSRLAHRGELVRHNVFIVSYFEVCYRHRCHAGRLTRGSPPPPDLQDPLGHGSAGRSQLALADSTVVPTTPRSGLAGARRPAPACAAAPGAAGGGPGRQGPAPPQRGSVATGAASAPIRAAGTPSAAARCRAPPDHRGSARQLLPLPPIQPAHHRASPPSIASDSTPVACAGPAARQQPRTALGRCRPSGAAPPRGRTAPLRKHRQRRGQGRTSGAEAAEAAPSARHSRTARHAGRTVPNTCARQASASSTAPASRGSAAAPPRQSISPLRASTSIERESHASSTTAGDPHHASRKESPGRRRVRQVIALRLSHVAGAASKHCSWLNTIEPSESRLEQVGGRRRRRRGPCSRGDSPFTRCAARVGVNRTSQLLLQRRLTIRTRGPLHRSRTARKTGTPDGALARATDRSLRLGARGSQRALGQRVMTPG